MSRTSAAPAGDIATESSTRLNPQRSWLPVGLFFIASLVMVFGGFSVGRKVNTDENVFIASAALLSRHFTLIYRDFHYNHMPTLVILYALLFRMTDYFLLAARSLSATCAAGSATICFAVAYESFSWLAPRRRMWMAIGAGVFFLLNPLFTRTAGIAWNHDFPVFMSLLAFFAMSRALERRSIPAIFISGLLIGLAVTTRLTFATEMLPFALFVLLYPQISAGRKSALLAALAAGVFVAVIPSVWVWAQSPANAYFGNFQYPALNTRWHFDNDDAAHHRDNVILKFAFFVLNTLCALPANGVIFAGLLVFIIAGAKHFSMRDPYQIRVLVLILLACSQLAAGLVPSPPFVQYYYAATPFAYLAVILCLGRVKGLAGDRGLSAILVGAMVLALGFGIPEYRGLPRLFWVPAWIPVHAHVIGREVAAQTGAGNVLTLDPIYALEGGLDIYPALATGPFGMRVGDYLSSGQQQEYRMWGTSDITRLFAEHPPHAVLISPGSDNEFERLFTQEVRAGGYRQVIVSKKNPAIFVWIHDPS